MGDNLLAKSIYRYVTMIQPDKSDDYSLKRTLNNHKHCMTMKQRLLGKIVPALFAVGMLFTFSCCMQQGKKEFIVLKRWNRKHGILLPGFR